MGTWTIKIGRWLVDGGKAYTVTLSYRDAIGVTSDWSLYYPTQAQTLAELEKKLRINVEQDETIEFLGRSYPTVADAVAAVTAAQPQWQ